MGHDENHPEPGRQPGADDARDQTSFDAEPEGFRDVHKSVHDSLAENDPTGQAGKPFLLSGFILVIVVALLVLLVIGIVLT